MLLMHQTLGFGWFWVFVGSLLNPRLECNQTLGILGGFGCLLGPFLSQNLVYNQVFGFWVVWARFRCLTGPSQNHTLNARKFWFWVVLGGYGVCWVPLLTHIWNVLLTCLGSFGCLLSPLLTLEMHPYSWFSTVLGVCWVPYQNF